MEENKEKSFVVIEQYIKGDDEATAEFHIDENQNLISDVLVTYVTLQNSLVRKPGVIKIPQQLIRQLSTIPREMYGVPIEILLALAHTIVSKEGQSLIQKSTEKEIYVPKSHSSN